MAGSGATTSHQGSRFAATRWSVVLAAGRWQADSEGRRAMSELARMYWFPLYAFLRRRGSSPAQAEDLVQGFFTHLLDKNALAGADQARGKFRSFLLAALNHYAANVWDHDRAIKRGGGRTMLSLDVAAAEVRYGAEPMDELTPDRVYERKWALAVLDQVLARLAHEYAGRGQDQIFTALKPALTGEAQAGYGRIATQLRINEGAVKVAAHRLRRRYRELLRAEIGQTVADPDQIDQEIRELLTSL